MLLAIGAGCGDDPAPPTAGGWIHGLAAPGLVVVLDDDERLALTLNGPFAFRTTLPEGTPYGVTLDAWPTDPPQVCTVVDATGVVGTDDAARIECVTPGIREFSVVRTLASAGDTIDVTWASREASSCTIDAAAVDPASTDFGSTGVVVATEATLTLTCETGGETASRALAVEVTDRDWRQLSRGSGYACAIKTDGRLFCWRWSYDDLFDPDSGMAPTSVPAQEPTGATDWDHVEAGLGNACAIKTDGRLFCWDLEDPLPVQEGTEASDWSRVSVSAEHACAIKTDGRLFCWGSNASGQLGHPDFEASDVPVQEATLASDWAMVSTGDLHSCALTTAGRIACWGGNPYGQLGDGSTTPAGMPRPEVTAATDWADVASGAHHTCARKTDGRVLCWGAGDLGQLGTGSMTSSATPVAEVTGADDWAQVSTREHHTCAVKDDGRLFCWGAADFGQLGNSTTIASAVPVAEETGRHDWAAAAAGGAHTCALTRDGRVFCWGRLTGVLGISSESANQLLPTLRIGERIHWATVIAAGIRTCGLTTDGRVFCWGWAAGALPGDLVPLPTANAIAPVQEATAATDWADLSTSGHHSCAIKTDGRLFCWGNNSDGALGDGSSESSYVPVQEATAATDWATVSVGLHSCALKTDGRLFCWGTSEPGGLGTGAVASAVPAQEATAASGWTQLAVGFHATCAVTSDHRLFCWGRGAGGMADSSVPVQVGGDADWAQVSMGDEHACAVKIDGRVFCWGANARGALGTGTTDDSPVPVQEASGAIDWESVSAGSSYTCATRMDGRLFCWGAGEWGQLGRGDVADAFVPVEVEGSTSTWALVAAGRASGWPHTCAIRHGGRLYCWGHDEVGELGFGAPPRPLWPAASSMVTAARDGAR